MEQKVPKHRAGSLRDLAQRRKVSHTTVRRQDRIFFASIVLTDILGEDWAEAVHSKRIRIGQEPLYLWYLMAYADPQIGKDIYAEILKHPDAPMKEVNDYIRRWYDLCDRPQDQFGKFMQKAPSASTEPEMDPELHPEASDRLSDEELELFQAVVDDELRKREQQYAQPPDVES